MKFAHIADTHIKNLKYHYEYRIVFEKLYEKLKKEKVDYIVHCGDLAHTKTQISPEFVEMCTNFLRSLADIAPTYVILGNHDGNLKNSSRQDALTPIVDALEHADLHLLKNSGEVCLNDEFTINVLSVFDRDNWANISDTNRINIALYHGSISNSKTDLGWTMEHGEDDISIFKGYDFAFLGDIHKTNQILDHKGTIRYAGSTVQQNHGETNDKGFLVWDIESKDNFTCKHITLENPKPFITIELTPKGRMPNKIKIPPGARVRLVSNNNLPLDIMKKAVEIAKHRFNPESITFLNRAAGERGNIDEFADGLASDNLRDPVVQEELIEEYLKDFQPEDDLLQRVIKLNSKYNRAVEDQEEVGRNVNWKLESLEWGNLFNYGDRNRISFSKLNGIVGIFGKNFSGKSSIVDSMLYTLFNSTSKNERKNLNIINQNKKCGTGKVESEETLEAKTDLNFECYDKVTGETQSLNGLTRNETDRIVRKHFGTLEDFLLTSMSSQLGSLQFISEGSTRRKEILAKFLDLEMFEKKYKMANEDASDLRGALKRLEGKEFDEDITSTTREVALNEILTEQHIEKCDTIKEELSQLKESSDQLNDKINSISAEVINIKEVERDLNSKQTESIELITQNIELNGNVNDGMEKLNKINIFLNDFNIKELEGQQENVQEKRAELEQILSEISTEEIKLQNQEKKAELLKEVPCGSEYSHCKFNEISELDPEKIEGHLDKYEQVKNKRIQLEAELKTNSALAAKNEIEYKAVQKELEDLDTSREEYYENREAILGKESLMRDLKKHQSNTTKKEKELEDCQQKLLDLYKEHGSVEQKLISLIEQQQELLDLREDFSAYDLFMRCMHPVINNEIAKVLANVVSFEVFFENDGRHLKILIKHAKHEPRPIEMGSGAEKTIAAMAIRLALLSVSNLPKSNIFILDEPGTSLDADNMDGFVRILDLVKSYFKTVFLISHLDSLKDCVDMQITIDKKGQYAYVMET